MASSSEISQQIKRLWRQHRSRVAMRTALVTAAGLGCLILLGWRLSLSGAGRLAALGAGAAGLCGLCAWQWQAVRRDWLRQSEAALKLDQALKLQARLITVSEFAGAEQPPVLYPLLLEDPALSVEAASKRLPRAVDRATLALAALFVLLALWPWPPHAAIQVAMTPPSSPMATPPKPPEPSPSPASQDQNDRQQSAGAQQQQQSAGNQQQQESAGGQQQDSSQHEQATGRKQSADGQSGSSDQSSQAKEQRQGSGQSAKADQGKADQQQAGGSQSGSQQNASAAGQSGQQPQSGPSQDATGQLDQKLSKTAEGQGQSPGGAQQLSAAQQEQLKAQIQQLLKEMSGELKQLQDQIASQQPQHEAPLPGTGTDPSLYDSPAALDPSTGSRLPIQIEVDDQTASSARPGTGTSKPSGQVSDEAPTNTPEQAALAGSSAPEQGVQRQAIPPEYRPVFERLSHDDKPAPL